MPHYQNQSRARQQYDLAYRLLRMEKHHRMDSATVESILDSLDYRVMLRAIISHREAHSIFIGWRWPSYMRFSSVRKHKLLNHLEKAS